MTINSKLAKKMYDKLNNVDGFKRNFPHLMSELQRGHVWTWDNNAITGEPSPVDIRKILDMELKGEHVYAVLDNVMLLGGRDAVHMTSYLFLTDYDNTDVCKYTDEAYYGIASVVNDTWGIEEMGDVFFSRCLSGGPRRIS